jgi:hypothetical protein
LELKSSPGVTTKITNGKEIQRTNIPVEVKEGEIDAED